MKQFKSIAIAAILFLGAAISVNAQSKIAHVNTQELLEKMTSYKNAMTELGKIEETFKADIDNMLKEMEKTNERYQMEESSKTAEENQKRMMKLQEMQQNIMEYNRNAQEQLQKKQESMLRPILEKARETIQKVAREKGYDYVLDSQIGTGVLMADGYNLLDDVIAVLK